MTKIKDFLLGCLARPLVAGFLVYLPISYSNYEPPQDLDLLVGIIGALIGGMLGAFFGQRSIPKNLEHQLKSMLIRIFYGLLITYIFPKALCVFYFEPGYDYGHEGCMKFRVSNMRQLMVQFFVPGCALAGLIVGLVKQPKNCKDYIAVNK